MKELGVQESFSQNNIIKSQNLSLEILSTSAIDIYIKKVDFVGFPTRRFRFRVLGLLALGNRPYF